MSPLFNKLTEALRCLPGVGPKTAQRMALDLLLQPGRNHALQLAHCLTEAAGNVGHCKRCRILSETDICHICMDETRDNSLLCVVEAPADFLAIETATLFNGYYHVLMGRLSPLDGIGPMELGLEKLDDRFTQEPIQEVVIATNATVEGEATAYYISDMAKQKNIKVTRIAQGVPFGGELEYIDKTTLAQAFNMRQSI